MENQDVPFPPGFVTLSKADQIHYLQQLWDQISQCPGELPVPASHLDLAEARLADYRRAPSHARSAFSAIDQLKVDATKTK